MAKTLIAYFSHAGQNYSHGSIRNLDISNTEVVAKKIHALIESDLFYIDTARKYPDDHMKKIEIAKREYNENARPELTARVDNMEDYDTVIVTFPNWWTTMPMAVFTFLESYDFSGKTICPSRMAEAASPIPSRISSGFARAPGSPRDWQSTATTRRPATKTLKNGSNKSD